MQMNKINYFKYDEWKKKSINNNVKYTKNSFLILMYLTYSYVSNSNIFTF